MPIERSTDPARFLSSASERTPPGPPGLVHWTAGAAHVHVSARASVLLGQDNEDRAESIARLWRCVEPADRKALAQAIRDLRVGDEPRMLTVRTVDSDSAPATWLQVGLEALPADATRSFDRIAYLSLAGNPFEPASVPGRLVCFDGLTGQPNRLLFRDQVHLALRRAARDRCLLAVLALDVSAGEQGDAVESGPGGLRDRVLRAAAVRIGGSLRAEDLVAADGSAARPLAAGGPASGGFGVLLPHIREPQDAARVALRIAEAVARPLSLDGRSVTARLATGIALYPWDDQEVDGLLRCAEQALEQARTLADGKPRFFSKPMNTLATDRLDLEADLRESLHSARFVLRYLPRVDGLSGRVLGNEALLRWNDPVRGLVTPSGFLDVAEQSGLMVPIGRWVLEEACRQARHWRDEGLPAVPVAVNISPRQFRHPDFVSSVAEALGQSGLEPAGLELELAEATLAIDTADAQRILRALKDLGVRLSIDDFGIGYSSLAYLKDFPIDALKVDRSFVHELDRNDRSASVTCAAIDLARHLGVAVVAEGVESQSQRRFLLNNGCREMQGYLFARPMSPAMLRDYWRDSENKHAPEFKTDSIVLDAPGMVQ